ncbi:hypothetical protein ASPVEDRAFT_27032 [Aspergillus versicolor CBS 583.65]|uniref:Amine oxidase domain-containing protein n=1 Tax=Aspergillus versicolor CBS 583.65 TaxID=1036611 RepID=A0A1L9PFK5_ASPVE|nr:uncharacterized protein ASPVEDRAFT_27032 [Aspergillus versicolor CBS 583.65]OJJ00290.1 hypothetical protein ASPVEDRAFT_27032 [Aspergillus versicolor CBS 583.65]
MAPSKQPNVAIIGAGLAGLRCADILIQNGAKVTIFDARNRVGGRVHQTKVGDHLVDIRGPNWIHGAGENPILNIANATGTTVHDFEGGQLVFTSDGGVMDDRVAEKISDILWTIIQEAFNYSNAHQDDIPAERSLLDFIRERLEKMDLSAEEKNLVIESSRLWGAYVGDPVDRQSLKFFNLEEAIDGTNYFVASTYKDILKHVSNSALQHADIRLNQPITKVDSNPDTQGTSTRREVTLTTEYGESHVFDEVVVTCPLGWLKRNKSAFTPKLPPRLSSAIDNISYGRLEKVYITFPEAFWHSATSNPVSLPPLTGTAPTQTTSNGTNGHTSNLNLAHFLNPSYHKDHPADIPWDQECFSMAPFPDGAAHPTLLFYTYGPCSSYIVNKLTSLSPTTPQTNEAHPPSTPAYNFLTTLFHPFYSLLPNYTPTSPSCTPLSILATRWQSDPYAGNGSYANFQTGLEEGDKDIEALRAGMGVERGVWFAGEHTAPFVALGTTTGALWSGERVAREVCALVGLGCVGVERVGRDDSLPSACACRGGGAEEVK